MEGKTLICRPKQEINIYLSQKELPAVRIAAHNLTKDIYQVCGGIAELTDGDGKIVIGTISDNTPLEKILEDKEINTECLRESEGNYRWEGYLIQEKDGVLYIIGTDRRGTIFGIYEFSKMIGVSPWHFFADVPVKKHHSIEIDKGFKTSSYPSVKYRGIFLNDEEELDAWAKAHTNDNTIGPETYVHVFELLLRLKANYIWPAMHVNYFNENPENGRLAEEMGIVVGTSHCDMLLRSNQNEWDPWIKKKGYEGVSYDYSIPGRNREILKEYWRESVEQNKAYEVCYTVGMRGIHDYGFRTDEIDHNTKLNMEEKKQEKVKLLGNIIQDQRNILKEVLGKENGETALQTFIPYKEVLPLYDEGLELPEDITLMWADDNFGYMRRYPDSKEQKRSGGHGVYFHNSYWAHPGMSYLYINSIPLAHTGNELKKCYENGIRKIWVLNVGALKPLEQDIEFFLTYGWEAGKEEAVTKDTLLFTQKWIDSNFTGNHGKKAADLYKRFAQITNVCKIEHLTGDKFSQTLYGDEAGLRVNQLKEIYDEANKIYFELSENERDAFFQLFLMKIHASYYANAEFYFADRSKLSYEQGKMQSADNYIAESRKMMEYRRCMLHFYNKVMSGGKWDRILTPESFSPPPTAMYPAGTPALKIEQPGANIIVWGERIPETNHKIIFDSYGVDIKWFEIFNTGAESFDFTVDISSCSDWVEVSENAGTVIGEKRILVKLKEKCSNADKKGRIVIKTSLAEKEFQIDVFAYCSEDIPGNFKGHVEADGFVSMKADHFISDRYSKDNKWQVIKDMGRMDGNVIEAAGCGYPKEEPIQNNASVTYQFLLKSKGCFLLEIHRFLTLNSTGRIRFAVAIDDLEPIILETETKDEWRGKWRDAVLNNGEKLYTLLPFMDSGIHKLNIYMIDRYVTISKLVVYTDKAMTDLFPQPLDNNSSFIQPRVSNLGPEESYFIGNSLIERNRNFKIIPECSLAAMEELCTNIYNMKAGTAPLPNLVYAGIDFWNYNRLYMLNEEYPQFQKGVSRYIPDKLGYKDVISEFGSGYFIENNGVIAIETEYAVEQSNYAYTQKSHDNKIEWTHTQAETNGGSGMAMHIRTIGLCWSNALEAPSLHYKIKVMNPGKYHVWMLIKFDDEFSDSCFIGLNGIVQPYNQQFSKGRLFTYSTKQIWFWTLLSEIDIDKGIHDFAIYAGESGLRSDRIYLTKGDENAPDDVTWMESERCIKL